VERQAHSFVTLYLPMWAPPKNLLTKYLLTRLARIITIHAN
jgi:hypothetical protein